MSRQFSFYIDETSYNAIDELVVSLGGAFLARPILWEYNNLKKISSISVHNKKDYIGVYIYPKKEEDKIILREGVNINNVKYYCVEELSSPVIEFSKCFYNEESKKLNEGRIYYNKGYWGENGEYIMKDGEFIRFADQLFSGLKKMLVPIKEGRFKGWYASKEVLEKVKNNQMHLKFSHE